MVENGHRYRSGAFEPLRSRGLRSVALLSIRRAIVNGVLRPGDRLMEADIAREMGISRGPVREALRQLEQEGLVISYPHRGTFVASLAADEASEIYVMRAVLEGLAA